MIEPRRIQITHLHETDAYQWMKNKLIGAVGMFWLAHNTEPGYYSGKFCSEDGKINVNLYGIRYFRV